MPVIARRLIRKMRGGAQAHLLEASDGHSYVVKFHNNPQHRRILVNEWIASTFLHYLDIASPEIAMVELTRRKKLASQLQKASEEAKLRAHRLPVTNADEHRSHNREDF